MNKKMILIGAIALSLSVSCSTKSSGKPRNIEKNSAVSVSVEENGSGIFGKSDLPAPTGLEAMTDMIFDDSTGDLYLIGMNGGKLRILATDSDFGAYVPIETEIELKELLHIDIRGNRICAVTENYSESTKYRQIYILDTTGREIFSGEIDIQGEHINSLVWNNDRAVICTDSGWFSMDESGQVLASVEGENERITAFSDGQLMALRSVKGGTEFCRIDRETLEIGDVEMTVPETAMGVVIRGDDRFIGYISGNNAVYGIRGDCVLERMIDLPGSGLDRLSMICPIAGEEFAAWYGGSLVRLSARNIEEIKGIQEITLAVAGKYDNIQTLITDFNAESTKYRIKVKDYSAGYEYSWEGLAAAADALEMDIISGKSPDLVWLDANETALLANSGAFADLYDFMDEDSRYTRDAFLPNYLTACEMNGHFYSIEPYFMIKTIGAKSKYVDTQNWNFDDFMRIFEEMPDGMELFPSGNNQPAVLSFLTDSGNNFIDMNKYTCDFNSPEFVDILRFAKTFPGVDDYGFDQCSCREDTALLSVMYIQSLRDLNCQVKGQFGEDVNFVGFPGSGGQGSRILRNRQFAIMADSPNKQGAWTFIRNILDKSNYLEGFPVTKKGLALAAEDAVEPYSVVDENGERIYMSETYFDWDTNQRVDIKPMTEEECQRYIGYIQGISKATTGNSDSDIHTIIQESTDAYFAGECSPEDAAATIHERVSILLSERS